MMDAKTTVNLCRKYANLALSISNREFYSEIADFIEQQDLVAVNEHSNCKHVVFYSDYKMEDGIGCGSIKCFDCDKTLYDIFRELYAKLENVTKNYNWLSAECSTNRKFTLSVVQDHDELLKKLEQQEKYAELGRITDELIKEWVNSGMKPMEFIGKLRVKRAELLGEGE